MELQPCHFWQGFFYENRRFSIGHQFRRRIKIEFKIR